MLKVCEFGLALALVGCAVSTGDSGVVEDVGAIDNEDGHGTARRQVDETCGGIAGLECDVGLYCNTTATSSCGAGDQMGICEVKPQICPMIVIPVCGCDGHTYPNPCLAETRGVSPAHPGACH